jgi:hypothetical protein
MRAIPVRVTRTEYLYVATTEQFTEEDEEAIALLLLTD